MRMLASLGILAALWAAPASAKKLSIAKGPLPNGTAGAPYSAGVTASGGVLPYTWSASGLPPGIAIDPMTGTISGTPSVAGAYSVSVQVGDSARAQDSQNFTIRIFLLVGGSVPNGTAGVAYSGSVNASGGTPPYTFYARGLPRGLVIDPVSGAISGTPTSSGAFRVSVTATDLVGATGSNTFPVTIAAPGPAVSITTTALPNGSTGSPYSATVTAANGTTPYSWTAAGLPSGLNIDGAAGVIGGTPSASGTSTVSVTVTDANGQQDSKSYSITIVSTLTITTESLPNGTVNASYSAAVTASGGTAPYTWSATGLPVGLNLNTANGQVTGTPTAAGSGLVNITVRDANAVTASRSYSLSIVAQLSITTAALPNGAVSSAYSATLAGAGGTPPYTWSAGGLPPGVTVTAQTGVLSGTPTVAGSYTVSATAADNAGAQVTKSFTVSIVAGMVVSTNSLPSGKVGSAYTGMVTASGGTPPYAWSVSSGALPGGLTLDSATGSISGTPTSAGTGDFVVKVSDSAGRIATASFSIAVAPATSTLAISGTLGGAAVGAAYAQTLTATGGTSPYSWSIISGSLPPGLALDSSGAVTGTPTQPGTFSFTIQVTDKTGATNAQSFTIAVSGGLTITTSKIPDGSMNAVYSLVLTATGGSPPYSWSVSGGALPTGLTLAAQSGLISGTTAAAGLFSFTIQVRDSAGVSVTQAFTVNITSGLRITSTSPLAPGALGASYSQALAAISGVPPYEWSVSAGALPPGLALDLSTGLLSGKPTKTGDYDFTAKVIDDASTAVSKPFTLRIVSALTVSTTSLQAGSLSTAYSQTLTAVAGTSPYTWALTAGSLPPGLTLNSETGAITGTPTTRGTFYFTVQVKDAVAAIATQQLSILIGASPTISSGPTLPNGTLGAAYSTRLAVSGGTPPYTWSVIVGSLPEGLTLSGITGALTGTPLTPGAFTFTVQVSDAAQATATTSLSLNVGVNGIPTVTITGLSDTANPLEQPVLALSLSGPAPAALTGELVLTFASDAVVQGDDPSIQFSTGGRTAAFTIAANATKATFPQGNLLVQTGSVAGTITLTVKLAAGGLDVTPNPAPGKTVRIDRTAPVIRTLKLVTTAGGFELWITGYAPSRELTQAAVTFAGAAGNNLQTPSVTVPMSEAAGQWYRDASSQAYGSQFTIVQPFTVIGTVDPATSVSVTLSNASGTSPAVSASF